VGEWTAITNLRIRSIGGPAEHSNEPSGFIKRKDFLDQVSDHQILNNNIAPWYSFGFS
jgi:hypothetical protein